MKRFDSLRRSFRCAAAALLAAAAGVAGTGCVDVDDTLGQNLIPDNQQMQAGYAVVDGLGINKINPRKYVETRLFQTDSIIGSNLTYGYLGMMANDTFGLRNAGFMSQFVNYYKVSDGYFGYKPFLDSAQIMLTIESYGADTLSDITFGVYEIISNAYLTQKPIAEGKTERDTVFYIGFDPEATGYAGNIVGDKLFTFTLAGSKGWGPSTSTVTMSPTPAGRAFAEKLMLQSGRYKDDYSIYTLDSLTEWYEEFNGLYIKPESGPTATNNGLEQGTIYGANLTTSGFWIYGRNRREDNPSLIKDTLDMFYVFNDTDLNEGNIAINVIRHDYSNAKFPIDEARETTADGQLNVRPECTTLYVSGLGGVMSEITFPEEFFAGLRALIDDENASTGKDFTTLAFSQVMMSVYFDGSSYDWTDISSGSSNPYVDIPHLIDQMNASQQRLGLYTNVKTLTPIVDYNYVYEETYSVTLAYGGYINRSLGCYTMDITGYMQGLWNRYATEYKAAKAENRAVNYDNIANRRLYLAPDVPNFFSAPYSVLQGEAADQNNASIRLSLTYNMIP